MRLDGDRIKPARAVKVDDKLIDRQRRRDRGKWWCSGISDKRGAAPVARLLYEETEASVAKRENDAEARKLYREPGTTIKGRPTKRDRRAIGKAGEW